MPHKEHWAASSGRSRSRCAAVGDSASARPGLTVSLHAGQGHEAPGSVNGQGLTTAISDLTSPATAILKMPGFLLRLVRHKVPATCCERLAGTPLG